ncbi:MAG TPA: type II secretion system protein, partial [Longimicrobiaceae bacterium]|nr:type II secretion system protein [Longimicrobiaceae bacterium]
MRRAAPEGGFTLIELVVALALTGLAMSLVAGSLWSAVEVRARQAETAEAEHRARVTREFLRETVRGLATERAGRGDLVVLRPEPAVGGVPSARLVLSTRGGAIFGWDAGLKAVELLVDRDPATPQVGLVARVFRLVPGGAAEDTLSLLPHAA